jgi:hypothetical protein
MLYATASGPPRPGSLLESVFILLTKRHQEAEYFKTKTLMTASLVDKLENGGKLLTEALDNYRERMFPFLRDEKKKVDVDSKKVLKAWTSKILKIRPLWRPQENKAVVSKLRKGAEAVKRAESLRRASPHRRI